MEELKTIVDKMNDLYEAIRTDNQKNLENKNKAAAKRARKNSVALGKLFAEFRKISVEANK